MIRRIGDEGISLGGITDDEGRFNAPAILPGQIMQPTGVAIEGDNLVWSVKVRYDGYPPSVPTVAVEDRILEAFLRIADGSPRQVLRFAAQWGVLSFSTDSVRSVLATMGSEVITGEERLEEWYSLARQARAIVHIAAKMHQQQSSSLAEWCAALCSGTSRIPSHAPFIMQLPHEPWHAGCMWIERVIAEWLIEGNVVPRFAWKAIPEAQPTITLTGSSLRGVLAVQLATAVSRAHSLTICSSCGSLYTPKRRPRAGERHYCPACGRSAAIRDGVRAHRERQKQARAM